jgi:hypothetical protein
MSLPSPVGRQPLLKTQGRAAAADSKTVQLHAFEVPDGAQALTLRFDYAPRRSVDRAQNARLVEAALEKHNARRRAAMDETAKETQRKDIGAQNLYRELNNLMNVVLIDPQGRWRGRWDRNPSSDGGDLVLTAAESSKGFLPGAILPGRWTAAVECHGIFGEEPVRYELEVATRPPLDDDERRALCPAAPAPGEQAAARRSGPGWYFGEMHSHTVHSDGKHELSELARRAAALGIDFLCLTDHNTTSGLLEAADLPVTLVAGCELTTFHGHHPIYGLTDIVPWHEGGRVLPMEELAPRIRAAGGVVSVAHPFKIGDPVCTGCRMRDDLSPSAFDLIEVWYRAWDAAETDNPTAYALWNSYWQDGRKVTAVAARDWHGPGQEGPFPGPAPFTAVWAEDNTPAAIVEGLRRGRAMMSGGPLLDLRVRAGAQEAMVGGAVRADGEVTLHVRAERFTEPVELRVFRNGERVRTIPDFGDGDHVLGDLGQAPGWYRVEAWAGGAPRVLTNHVVVEPA